MTNLEKQIYGAIATLVIIALIGIFTKKWRKAGIGLLVATAMGVAGLFGYIAINGTSWMINPGPTTKGESAHAAGVEVVTVASGLEFPWSVAFLPDGRFLVTERDAGKLKLLKADGTLQSEIGGVPPIAGGGQGGLLEVALHPDFATNKLVYLTFSEGTEKSNSTALARGVLSDNRLTDVKIIFSQRPKVESSEHFGGRLMFTPTTDPAHPYYLWLTLGERFHFRDQAQLLENHLGKIIRLFDDGSVPPNNPYVGQAGKMPEIWSYGHRNVQGITTLGDGTVLTIEHGPQGGDELNKPEAGKNYGWPVITYGEEYGGGKIGAGITQKAGMEQPLKYWVPSFAPSSLVRLSSDVYPAWKDNLFATSLAHRQLVRLEMDGLKVKKEQRLLSELDERLRDVAQGPDGKLYLLTDSAEGRLIRLDPKQK
jgi:aldose sugar dehydrogenase